MRRVRRVSCVECQGDCGEGGWMAKNTDVEKKLKKERKVRF